jgi:hypothetical protein
MPIRPVPGFNLNYYLVCFDATGAERSDDPDGVSGRLIPRVAEAVEREPYTDVFLMSHGWMGDVPAAIQQYDRWIAAMATCESDLARASKVRLGFRPILVGIHWPSLPYGDEEMAVQSGTDFSTTEERNTVEIDTTALIEIYAERIADTPAARRALETIFAAAATDTAPLGLSREVADAYRVLNKEAKLGDGGPANEPGSDRDPFDPDAAYQAALVESETSFGTFGLGPVLSILRNLSFFKMKDRARMIGESSGHGLLAMLQATASRSGREVRFHLMGHSFGCIVMSGVLTGPAGKSIINPVHSAFLVQGAISFWSYCGDIPYDKGHPGYFRSIVDRKLVTGALVTTQSKHDTAVGRMYPLAAGARGDVDFATTDFPKYGALGAFGARGPGVNAVDLNMLESSQPYNFEPGSIYNIESSKFIAEMQSLGAGAHSDIAHPEVAHAMWSAALL